MNYVVKYIGLLITLLYSLPSMSTFITSAIEQSDLANVDHALISCGLTPGQKEKLLDLAQEMINKRRTDHYLYLAPEILLGFISTKILLGGIVLTGGALITTGIPLVALPLGVGGIALTGVGIAGLSLAVYLYRSNRHLYYNAIQIKQHLHDAMESSFTQPLLDEC